MSRARALVLLAGVLASGCINLELEPGQRAFTLDDCARCATNNPLSGEVMLFINGKLTDEQSGYTVNKQDPDTGAWYGSSLYLYDPRRRGTLVKLGNVELGPDADGKHAYDRFQFRDLAWSPEHGLWAITYESLNDEWRLTRIEVPSLRAYNARLPQQSWALRTADPAYNEYELSGMEFIDGALYVGAQASAATTDVGGALYVMDLPTGYSEDPVYPGDATFYSDKVLSRLWARFSPNIGVAGDLARGAAGGLVAMVRGEPNGPLPLDVNRLYRSPTPEPALADASLELKVRRNEDFQGLARIDGVLYAIDTGARVYRLNEENGSAELVEDLSLKFDDAVNGVRIRGATTVEIPAP